MGPREDDEPHVVPDPDIGDRVGAIEESGAEGSSVCLHVFGREGEVIWSKAFFEDVEGVAYLMPFYLRFDSCGVEIDVFTRYGVEIKFVSRSLGKGVRHGERRSRWYHSIHWWWWRWHGR